jgi:hypothetical protein
MLDLFIDPISHERMEDPVINSCGHSFSRCHLEGYTIFCLSRNQDPAECPLCRQPLTRLVDNILLRNALEVLEEEEVTEEEQEVLDRAAANITKRRSTDDINGIPDRTPEAQSFLQYIKGGGVYTSPYAECRVS